MTDQPSDVTANVKIANTITTYERIEETPPVVKKNGDREEFNRANSSRHSSAFEKRPFSAKEQEDIVSRIETKLREIEDVKSIRSNW